jgi:ComF family protein
MIERFFEFIAPDCCIVCNKESLCLCVDCEQSSLTAKKPSCVLCNALTSNGQICNRCRPKTKLAGASVAYRYEGTAKELITRLKYHSQRSVARFLGSKLPNPQNAVFDFVTYVPSDGPTRRRRGFNQAELIARAYAKSHGVPLHETLLRQKHVRQVGLNRKQRLAATADSFVIARYSVNGKKVLLVDDVVTTGATLSECAKTLRQAGASKVWGLVVAKK